MAENENNEEKKVVLHKVVVDRDPEVDSLHSELEKVKQEKAELQAMLVQAALKATEDKKEELKKKYPQAVEAIDLLNSPQDIDELAERLKQKHSHIIAGKSSLTPRGSGEEFEDQRALVDNLYHTAYFDPSAKPEQKKEAIEKIGELVTSMFEGKSWNQLKNKKSLGKKTEFMACPRCNATIDLEKSESECYSCGWRPKRGDLGRE